MMNSKANIYNKTSNRVEIQNLLTSRDERVEFWSAIVHNIPVAVSEVLISCIEQPNAAQQSSKAVLIVLDDD